DAEGNTTSITDDTGTSTLQWDSRNRLVALTGPTVEASFSYDVFGRRVRKTVNGATTQYLYDGPDVATETRDGVTLPYLRLLGLDKFIIYGNLASSGPGGSSEILNQGMTDLATALDVNGDVITFNSGQIDEVVAKAREAARAGRPVYIIGHSKGGEAAVKAALE